MSKKPIFSVIVPVKGRLPYTKEAINSVLNQKGVDASDIEIIVVEEKNPVERIRNHLKKLYPQIKIVLNIFEDYSGGSRNSGLKEAEGKYILFLDSDDQLFPHFLIKMSHVLANDKSTTAAVCFSKAIFAPGYNLKEYIKWHLLMLLRDVSLLLFYFFHQTYLVPSAFYLCQISHMLFKRENVKNMKFDYQYRFGGEDWDFINHVQDKGLIRIVPYKLTIFRYSYNSSTVLPINKKLKWRSYLHLASKLSSERKKGLYYKLFLQYINLFRVKN